MPIVITASFPALPATARTHQRPRRLAPPVVGNNDDSDVLMPMRASFPPRRGRAASPTNSSLCQPGFGLTSLNVQYFV
jgi:hypothetical protein